MHKSGFVNIIGNPNVGKSTLMNALVGEKLSIITSKAQTTRHRIMGIVSGEDFQIVYSDTPGILKPSYKLQESMMKFVTGAVADADVILYVTDTVERGERVALVGRNGSGKSSLLRLALGEEIPHTGLFSLASGLVVSYVPQDASFLRGSLSQFARRSELDETQFKTILRKLDFARVQFEKDLSDYSAGQKKKVLLARSLCQSAHLYVWDEPLNYIDVFSRMQLEELLRVCRPAMLLVEHDQAFLEGLADKRVKLVPA